MKKILGDPYYKLARNLGYRSRAAFKLLEINKKFKIIKNGFSVLDLGAAPGGWIQVVREAVGSKGLIVAVDLKYIKPLPWSNVVTIRGNVENEELIKALKNKFNERFDVILSDLSPNITGIWEIDHARQIFLTYRALKIANNLLKKNGAMIAKVFQGDLFNNLLMEFKCLFSSVAMVKPKASRTRSAEVYVVARGFKAY
ncbi:MAG: RlmE family RNA methyltransferase [Candidatus Methanomethylicia archaeon]